jgi:hypothetical protein
VTLEAFAVMTGSGARSFAVVDLFCSVVSGAAQPATTDTADIPINQPITDDKRMMAMTQVLLAGGGFAVPAAPSPAEGSSCTQRAVGHFK